MKKWRKVGHCALFVAYLHRFCLLMRTNRQTSFKMVKGTLKANLNVIREDLAKILSPFFEILLGKREVSLCVEE